MAGAAGGPALGEALGYLQGATAEWASELARASIKDMWGYLATVVVDGKSGIAGRAHPEDATKAQCMLCHRLGAPSKQSKDGKAGSGTSNILKHLLAAHQTSIPKELWAHLYAAKVQKEVGVLEKLAAAAEPPKPPGLLNFVQHHVPLPKHSHAAPPLDSEYGRLVANGAKKSDIKNAFARAAAEGIAATGGRLLDIERDFVGRIKFFFVSWRLSTMPRRCCR